MSNGSDHGNSRGHGLSFYQRIINEAMIEQVQQLIKTLEAERDVTQDPIKLWEIVCTIGRLRDFTERMK